MRMLMRRHASWLWREPALWIALVEAVVYLGLLAYMLNVVRGVLGD
jgi:hypothetical protein